MSEGVGRWRARDVAGESLRRRAGAPSRVIWESGGIPERVLADVFARYATMRGWEVERDGGAVLVSNHISYLDFVFCGLAARPARRRWHGRFPL